MGMDKETALNLLKQLIDKIRYCYAECNDKWQIYAQENNVSLFNQKTTKVKHTECNSIIWESINAYDQFLNIENYNRMFDYDQGDFCTNSRVKNTHSLEEKREEYIKYRREKGEVSVSKCFNDLFGIRAIIEYRITKEELEVLLLKYLKEIVIEEKDVPVNRSGYGYKAIHIYFKKDNLNFRWELQIWNKENQCANM